MTLRNGAVIFRFGSGGGGDANTDDLDYAYGELFQVLGCPDNFKTRLAAFLILEGDCTELRGKLIWLLRLEVTAFADTCTWVAFRMGRYVSGSRDSVGVLWWRGSLDWLVLLDTAAGGLARGKLDISSGGLNEWVLVERGIYECCAGLRCCHEGQGQQENKGRLLTRGACSIGVVKDQSVEHRGRQDRGYDSRRQDFQGQDQRFNGRNGNDRQGAARRGGLLRLCLLHLFVLPVGKPSSGVCIRLLGMLYLRVTQHKGRIVPSSDEEDAKYANRFC
ncbi:hypothetical protein Tco_0153107 [Tanacetum coccineum]